MEGNKNIRKEDIKKALDLKLAYIIFVAAIIVADILCCCLSDNIYKNVAIVFASIIVGIIILSIENKASLYIKNIFVASTIIVVDVSCCCSFGNIYLKGAVVFASIILEAVILSIENKESFYIKWDNIIFASAIIVADVLCCCSIGNIYQKCAIVFISIIIGYFILSIENKIEKIKRILNKAISFFGEKRIKDDGRNLLSPCMVDKNSPAYFSVQELLYVSKKEGCRNIALTGVYGSGKSSILKTFMSLLPSRTKVLQISLSNFLSLDAKEEDIEKKVFQHIIFKANQAETAQTDFDRKSVISRNKAYAHAICLVFIILCFMLITKSSLISIPHIKAAFGDIFKDNNNFYAQFSAWWYVFFSAFVVVYAVYIIKHIIRRVPKLKLKYVGKEGLEFDFDKKDVFNRMLGEIVYFLKAGKYDMVIFEDLDRIKDPRNLFLKLRELNLLINESDDYIKNNKTIRFIYAIRDDVYREELRTKIFDYIIPVIPIVDKFNAGDYLIHNYCSKKGELMYDIKKADLKELGSYIDNMRTLKNVVNEYRLYKDSIGITGKELLALTVYKNLFPSDYSLLHQKKGCLHAVISNPDRTGIKQICEDYLTKNKKLYNLTEDEIMVYADSITTTIEDMIIRNYIPKDIDSFIACFKPNSLIKKDNDFCERVINGGKDNPSFHLEDPWDVVDYLPEEAFKHNGILNYGIADVIFNHYRTDNEKSRLFINTVMNNVQFIFDYLDPNNSDDTKVNERLEMIFESFNFLDALLASLRNNRESELQSKLFELVTKASEQGVLNAHFVLGYCYNNGYGVEKDPAKAPEWFTKAAEHGFANAITRLIIPKSKDGVREDITEAKKMYTKAVKQVRADSMYKRALIYEKGEGVKNITKAIELYTEAAEKGNANAMYNLAEIYYGYRMGIKKDITKAVEWYTKAAEQGHTDAMNKLAFMYELGININEDKKKAVELYTKAAEKGDADAMNKLARIYEQGDGVEKDMAKATEWYTKAAEQGHTDAMNKLALIYQKGDGVEKDITKAIELYTKAAEQGNAGAMFNLALIYENGDGVEKDVTKAIELYTKAAEQGHTDAMNKLALIYQNGDGVEKNITKAIEWYTKAAEQGIANAMGSFAWIFKKQDLYDEAMEQYEKALKIAEEEKDEDIAKQIQDHIQELKDLMDE